MGLHTSNHRGGMSTITCRNIDARKARLLRTLIVVGASLIAWPNGASAAPATEFKCYVIAADGTAHLRLLESKDLGQAQMAAAQPWKQSKKRVLGISQVVECQPMQASFADPAARLLDERTPR